MAGGVPGRDRPGGADSAGAGAAFGDVVGDATLTLEPAADGCIAVLHSSLAPGNTALAVVSRLAGPIAGFGHDWVLDSAARQFIARAIEPALSGAAS